MTKKTKITPFEDRVLIKPDKAPKMTDAGLYIPEQAQDKLQPSRGTVIAVGPGKMMDNNDILVEIHNILVGEFGGAKAITYEPIPLSPGDRVMYGNHAGTPVEDPDTKEILLIMRFTDCFAGLQEGEE